MSRDGETRNLISPTEPTFYESTIMSDDDVTSTNQPSTRSGSSILDSDSFQSESVRLPAKAKFALVAVYIAQIFASLSVTIIQSTLYVTCTDILLYDRRDAVAISLVFACVKYVSCIIGGFLSDIMYGCYKVCFMSCCLLMIGQTISYLSYIFSGRINEQPTLIRASHVTGVMLVAVGQALFDVTIIPLGMRHMIHRETSQRLSKSRQQLYLRGFIFTYALGTFLAFFYMSQQNLLTGTEIKKQLSSSLPLWATGGLTFILIMGKRSYLPDNIQLGKQQLSTFMGALVSKFNADGGLSRGDKRQLLRLFGLTLLSFSALSAYLAIYFQTDNTYMDQLRNLTSSKTHDSFQPEFTENMAVSHPVVAMVTILVLTIVGRWTPMWTHWHMVTVGIIMSAISVACASGIEKYISNGIRIDYRWLLPQFGFMGCSEVFYFVGGYELCYAISMKGLETVTLGLFLGVGSVFSIFLYLGFIVGPHYHTLFFPMFLLLLAVAIITIPLFIFFITRCIRTRRNLPSHLVEPPTGGVPTSREDSRPAAIWDNF